MIVRVDQFLPGIIDVYAAVRVLIFQLGCKGKDGIAVKLVSKEFALKWLDKHYSEATDLQKAQIEQLRAQTDKLKADNENAPDDSTQCAMDAITGIVEQMQPLKDDDV